MVWVEHLLLAYGCSFLSPQYLHTALASKLCSHLDGQAVLYENKAHNLKLDVLGTGSGREAVHAPTNTYTCVHKHFPAVEVTRVQITASGS